MLKTRGLIGNELATKTPLSESVMYERFRVKNTTSLALRRAVCVCGHRFQ